MDRRQWSWLVVAGGLLGVWIRPVAASDDWQLWIEQKWRVKLHPRVALIGRSDVRFRTDMSDFYKQTDNVGLSFKPTSWLKVEPVYQYEWSEQARVNDTTIENRLYVNLIPHVAWGPLHFEDRNRIEFRHINGRDDWRYRNKPKLSLELGEDAWYACEPFVADELFYGARAGEWNRNRFFVGVEKPLGRLVSTELYYMIESNKQGRDWDAFHVLGLTTAWSF